MMRRSPFGNTPPRRPAKQWTADALPGPRLPLLRLEPAPRAIVTIEKENALQHEGYINLVRAMRCIRCQKPPRSQFCHADEGKGIGIKTDCRRGWPGCADCHYYVGTSGRMTKAERRAFESQAGADTRAAVRAAGAWPPRLPEWADDMEESAA